MWWYKSYYHISPLPTSISYSPFALSIFLYKRCVNKGLWSVDNNSCLPGDMWLCALMLLYYGVGVGGVHSNLFRNPWWFNKGFKYLSLSLCLSLSLSLSHAGVWMPITSRWSQRTVSRVCSSCVTCGWMTTAWPRCPLVRCVTRATCRLWHSHSTALCTSQTTPSPTSPA